MIQKEPQYYYFDNWSGTKKSFHRLRDAKIAAKKETGVSITIRRAFDRLFGYVIRTDSQYTPA